jgi:CubicO group peptidase (beta-lactamase class C family)
MKTFSPRFFTLPFPQFLTALVSLLAVEIVTAQGSAPLQINCPLNRTNWVCGVTSLTFVTYPSPTTTGSCPTNATVTCTPPSGSTFILGTTIVNCRATNSCRESAVCSFSITVARDTIAPLIQCPGDRTVPICGVASTTPVSFPLPPATDNADASVAISCSPPSGSSFPVGTTTVACTATDDCTNRSTCTFLVRVIRDTTAPVIQCLSNRVALACDRSGALVTYSTPTATDDTDPSVTVACSPKSDSLFPVGNTTVTCTATDACTNRSTCLFLVTVNADTTPPVIQCPSNIVLWTCSTSAITHYSVTATDDLDTNVEIACTPPSGSLFAIGQTTVVCTATDNCTNRTTCTFTVTVNRDATPPSIVCPTNIVASICSTCAVSQCVANLPPPIRPASVGNGLFYASAVEPDLTATQFDQQMNSQAGQGYHAIHVNAYQPIGQSGTASVKFGSAWVRDDDSAFTAFSYRDQDAGDLQFVESLQEAWGGTRLISLSGYKINANETRFAAAYLQDGSGYPWRLILDRDFDQYQAEIEALAAQGYRPISVSGYSFDGANPRYSGIFVQDGLTGSDWVTAHRIAEGDYQDWIDGWWDDGFRPISVSAYTIGEETFFTAVMVRVPNSGAYVASHGMTENEFLTANANWTNPANNEYGITFRPVVVAAYRSFYNGGAKRYAAVWRGSAPRAFTVTGPAQPSLASLDNAMRLHMQARDINAASLCVSKDGGIVLHRGYTWAPAEFKPTQPCSRFRIASASKPITAIAVMKLLEGNYLVGMKGGGLQALTLDTPVFQMNGMPDLPAAYGAKAQDITIRQLLQHRAGWGYDFDPLYVDLQVAADSGSNVPLSRQDRINYMMTPSLWPTPGDPGSVGFVNLLAASKYSNFGFSLLAELIEVVSNQPYETFVRNEVLAPAGATHTLLGRTSRLLAWSSPDEVTYTSGIGASPRYYVSDEGYDPLNILNPAVPSVVFGGEPGASDPPSAYGRYNIETIDAAGGWVATSDDLVRLLRSFDNYNPDQPGTGTPLLDWLSVWEMWSNPANLFNFPQIGDKYVLGWQQTTRATPAGNVIELSHGGDIDGAHSSIVRRADGITFAVLVSKDVAGAYTLVSDAIDAITRWPVCQDGAVVNFPSPIATDNADANVSVVCVPPSGSYFPLGFHSVTCTATDNCGNQQTCQFRVTLKGDNTPPSIQCPTNRIVWTCSTNGAVVTFPAPVVSDDTDANPSVVCVPPSGTLFPVGRTVVTCTATDDCTNRNTCTFTVTVNADTTRPILYCPPDQIAWACSLNGVVVNFPAPLVFDNHDLNPSVVCVPPSGSLFPVGTTTVTCTATDDCTNRSSCTFRVTVNRDATPPTLQCPSNILVWSCDANGVAVNYPAPMVNDNSGAAPIVVCQPPPGSVFPHGVTIVTCRVTDACSNSNSCTFQVRVVRDSTPPTIVCPTNRIRYTCETAGGPAIYPPPEASDNEDPDPEVVCTPPFGSPLPLGTNTMTCVVTDRCGNTNACSFTIDMRIDTIPPVITCPDNRVLPTCDPRGVVVTWPELEVTDNFISNPQYSCTPKSGSVFPIGMTTVTCEARDSCGNTSTCSFKVTVVPDVEIPGTDTNGDGLSDIWQTHFNAHGLAPGADTDGDGMTNAEEARAGTNPRDPGLSLRIDSIERVEDGSHQFPTETIKMTYGVQTSKLVQLQLTADLGMPWADFGLPKRGSGVSLEFRIRLDDTNLPPTISTQAFFRLAVFDIDEDGDGVTAWEESIIGTSDLTANTHGNPGGDHQAAQDWIAGNAPQPRLREVALAHIGGSPDGPTQTKLVTATGTGGWLKLSSWTLNPGTTDPTPLQDTAPFEGWNAKLHVLEPPLSPTLSLNPFVSARLRDDANLWLTTRRVDAVGAHSEFETIGYGANASFSIYDYAMAHRAVTSGPGDVVQNFILITPVMGHTSGGQKQLRVITWSINPLSGDINGLFDTGDLGHSNLPDDGGRLQIAPEGGSRYVLSYVNSKSELSSWFFDVNAAGLASARGGKTSGVDIRGTDDVVEGTTDFALGALNSAGFVTLLTGTDCTARLAVWEDRVIGGDPALISQPFFITDNTLDQSPNGHGILLNPPTLTDSTDGNGVLVKVRGLVTDAQWEQSYGTGAGELFLQMPPNEPTNVHAASVTKCMTLLIATEILALPGIDVDLGDPVPVSAKAAGTGGSFMGDNNSNATVDDGERPILEGDELPLRLLLSGMMAPSCNKSSRAIAEFLGAKHRFLLDGVVLTTDEGLAHFVGLMNTKAMALEMNATIYGDSWGGGITTPQDLVTLWREGWKHELFRIYSSATLVYSDCGTDALGEEICFFVQKSTPWYPGLQAWKGGGGGFFIDGVNRPLCTTCLLGQSTRLDRSLIAALQQSGDRADDAARLWDYGYRLLFTPDYRGGGGINTPAITDFALRKIHDTLAVSAVIYGADQLRLDAWQVVAGIGQAGSLNSSTLVVNNLPAGTHAPRTKILDVTKLPTVGEAEADYLTGHLEGGDLRLNLWRLAAEPGQ